MYVHEGYTLAFHFTTQPRVGVKKQKKKHRRTLCDGDADKKVQFQRVAQGESSKGDICRVEPGLDGV